MFLNSTRKCLIWIEDVDQEMEGEEPFQSRIGSGNFVAKRRGTFAGWIRVMKPVLLFIKRESEISQHDTVIINCKQAHLSLIVIFTLV